MYEIFLTEKSEKELTKLAKDDAKEVLKKIKQLRFPLPVHLNIKKLTGEKDFYRLRAGKTRAIFQINHRVKEILIRKIGYRRDVYRF
jgi:mRNA-degrading endonuclease RelE of RelBE toxin-antitoxin system